MNLKVIAFIILLSWVSSTVTEEADVCTEYLSAIVNGSPNSTLWIMQMLDASAKLPSGMFDLNLVDLGSFDECIGIRQSLNSTQFTGKYCAVNVDINAKMFQPRKEGEVVSLGTGKVTLMLGWCVPSVCPIRNFTNMVEILLKYTGLVEGVKPYGGGESTCQTQDSLDAEWPTADLVLIGFLIIIFAIIVASTAYDFYIHYTKQVSAHVILLAFSIKSNGKKLLDVSHNPDQLLCLHGIRFLSMVWIIFGHSIYIFTKQPLTNIKEYNDWLHNLRNTYVIGGSLAVDTFFFLSGLLVSYMFLLSKEKGAKLNLPLYTLHRYIRLTPAFAIVVWTYATIITNFGSGPLWLNSMAIMKAPCVKYWWSTLLYLQNYVNTYDVCVPQTWYLAVDTQLYNLSPLLLIPLWRHPQQTVKACIVLVFGSCVTSFLVTWVYELPGVVVDNTEYMAKYYTRTYTRYGPWLIGFLLGYVIYKHKRIGSSRLKLRPLIVILGWISSVAVILTIMYTAHNIFTTYTNLQASFFNGLHTQCWALSLCWVTYACIFGYGGPINKFLSCSLFQVLSRFTYTMYLTHSCIQVMNAASGRTTAYFSPVKSFHRFWGDFFFTLFFAVCLTLAFESPILVIEKVLFKTDKKKKEVESRPLIIKP